MQVIELPKVAILATKLILF